MSAPLAGVTMRLARVDEAALVRDVMLACWTGTAAANSSAYRETDKAIAEQLRTGGAAMLVFDGPSCVGSGRIMPVPGPIGDDRPWAELKRVGILRSHRKLGLGGPLALALEAEAQKRGAVGCQLGVRADQPRLVQFWAGLGYAAADDVRLHTVNPLTPPPVTMRKRFT